MLRGFQEHGIRPVRSLDGLWEFVPDCDRKRVGNGIPRTFTRTLQVPSVWETIPDLKAYRGRAWYRRKFSLDQMSHVRIRFGGVSHTAAVWVDGNDVGGHYDAFTPWDVVVRDLSKGEHTLTVRVDNDFGEHSSLHIPNDYYTYGGINRPVELQEIPDLYLDGVKATPLRRGGRWLLDVNIRVRNVGSAPLTGKVVLRVAGSEAVVELPEVAAGQTTTVHTTVRGLDVEAWSETAPNLYDLVSVLQVDGVQVDDLRDRVGFREIRVKGRKVLLNGEELHLRGFNRHEDHPSFGCAIPPEQMAADLEQFRDLNCNFLRTCHYPNDMRLLDMCDERGIYVWEESHSRQTPFDHPRFNEQIRDSTVEMVENHFNHPCIVMWGSLNECDTRSEAGEKVHATVLGLLKELDGSRPVTYAANHRKEDRCLGLVDIVSWNLYTGWYGDPPEKTGEVFEDLLQWLDSAKSHGGKGKPVILSEFGGGAIYGCRTPQADFWSEEYQAHLLDATLETYLTHPRIVGAAIWQYCDVRVSREKNPHRHNSYGPIGRPRTMNNKGVVDEYRRPKLAVATVREHMEKAVSRRGRV